jgi:uncharacterized protein YndB with AHSA1/START domain
MPTLDSVDGTQYVTYIATSAERLWQALTDNDLRKQWWRGHYVESSYQPGAELTGYFPDGSVELRGRVVAADPGRRLAYEGRAVWHPDLADELNRLTFEIKPYPSMVALTFSYQASEQLVTMAQPGWPAVLSSLKTLLETGKPLDLTEVFGPERNPAKQ